MEHAQRGLRELMERNEDRMKQVPDAGGSHQLLHEGFVGIAHRHPGRPAVVGGGTEFTYAELDEGSHALAHTLLAAGVRPEMPVAVLLPRSAELLTCLLGIWRAGGAYVPLDPRAPLDRLLHMVEDSEIFAVLTTAHLRPLAESLGRTIIEVGLDGNTLQTVTSPGDVAGTTGLLPQPDSSRLAYVLFTSGTTGRPKGVRVEHGSLTAMAQAHENHLYAPLRSFQGRVALNNPATTDAFFSEFAHLSYGRTLYVLDEDTRRDPDRLAAFLDRHDIEALDATPTQVRALLIAGHLEAVGRLRCLVLGGEPVDARTWSTLRALSQTAVYNLYGPTECTVDVMGAALSDSESPVIGRPWPGTEVLLLDSALQPVPDGASGEICVSGPQLARGYVRPGPAEEARFTQLNLPGRTQAVRIYRTGDLARRNSQGMLDLLGRADDQVKVRGYRVELAEVEAALRKCSGVLDTAVALQQSQASSTLMAWVVTSATTELDQVRRQLSSLLPDYMVPVLAVVPRIPMAVTGKADVKALLALSPAQGPCPLSSSTDVRAGLLNVWKVVLDVPEVAPQDTFFDLGGDSLKATQMTMRCRQETGKRIPVRLIFDHPAFADYCLAVSRLG
ncbi:hypothetical protein AV521_28560 [Streptomyces sp. IMTB 2501]|uniref:non-ribosomal peptide synthetase n=1 Tax=Streptomyces sp. IMTB 2501 TaxID=1776340 RepID=UPI00096FBDE3|nr:non-ribosomal peptide synthetase [Streptomyces sp. IMTB 2501]OLZ66448.1 hypothetical protein AV521_28560 [Streptomyces sp. IMTB 2501]